MTEPKDDLTADAAADVRNDVVEEPQEDEPTADHEPPTE